MKMEGNRRTVPVRKKLLTVFLLVLLAGIYFMIFRFSADDGESSSRLSMRFSESVARIYCQIFEGGGSQTVTEAAGSMESLIRKMAHFAEYMTLGLLSGCLVLLWIKSRRRCFFLVLVQLVFSAGLDELHQYFVPGRYASVRDVVIDVSGGITGLAIVFCLKGIVDRWNHIRKQESEICF